MSWQKIKGLKENRGEILAQAEAIVSRAEAEGRSLNSEESAKFDELRGKADTASREIDAMERRSALDAYRSRGARDLSNFEDQPGGVFETKDLRGYSLVRAIRAKMDGRALDGLEREVSDELARRSGKSPQGFYFPMELPFERRDLNLTTGAGAKPTDTDGAQFIDLLRSRLIVKQLGARVLDGLRGDLSIPKQTGTTTAYWITEGNAPTESNATIGQISLAPKTVGAYTDLSRKFILQSSVSAEQFTREDLAHTLAQAIDLAALNGSGTGAEPQGILQNGSVTTVALGTNGAAPTYSKLVEMETTVAAANADMGSLAYATTAQARGKLKSTEKVADTAAFIWGDDNTVNGYRAVATTLLPSNLTKGTGTALSAAIFANWADLLIGLWSGLDILVDPYTGGTSGTVRVVALQDLDIKLRRTESFCKVVDMVTA